MTPANNDGASSGGATTPSPNQESAMDSSSNDTNDKTLPLSLIQQLQEDFVAQGKNKNKAAPEERPAPNTEKELKFIDTIFGGGGEDQH